MRIRPPAREQRPVPTTNRLRLHEHAAPPLTGKHPSQRGQEHPISRAAARPTHLPAKHCELVTQNEYLDLVRGVRSTPHHQASEEMSKQPVEARDEHQTILPTCAPIRRTEFPAPSRRAAGRKTRSRRSRWARPRPGLQRLDVVGSVVDADRRAPGLVKRVGCVNSSCLQIGTFRTTDLNFGTRRVRKFGRPSRSGPFAGRSSLRTLRAARPITLTTEATTRGSV